LARAIQTAAAFKEKAPITPQPLLNERSRGIYGGKKSSEVSEKFKPRFASLNDDMDGGESLASIAERVGQATREIVERHSGGTVMIVGHSGVLRLSSANSLDSPLKRQSRKSVRETTRYTSLRSMGKAG
jgi:2,3-bisphosphoglycerate-dependent phosphoglycerate mutase